MRSRRAASSSTARFHRMRGSRAAPRARRLSSRSRRPRVERKEDGTTGVSVFCKSPTRTPSSKTQLRIPKTRPNRRERDGRDRRRLRGRPQAASGQEAKGVVSATRSRFLESFFDEHDRDVADNRIDAMALHAAKPLLNDGLLAAELVAELIAHGGALTVRQRDLLHLFLVERAREDFQKLGVDHLSGVYQGEFRISNFE